MRYLFFIFTLSLAYTFSSAATLYSITNGDWDDGTIWSTTADGLNPVGGTINANDNHDFNIYNGDTINFNGYTPNDATNTSIIRVHDGQLQSSGSFNVTSQRIIVYKDANINIANDFNIEYLWFRDNVDATSIPISVGDDLSINYLFTSGNNPNYIISSDNAFIKNYNFYWNAIYQANDISVNINITDATGELEIDSYFDSPNSILTINNGNFDFDDNNADINGSITVNNGDLILTQSNYIFNVYGSLESGLSSNLTPNASKKILIQNGGNVSLSGSGNEITTTGNLSTDGIQVESGGTLTLLDIDFEVAGYSGPYEIAGDIIMEDADFNFNSGGASGTLPGSLKLTNGDVILTNGSSFTVSGLMRIEDGNVSQYGVTDLNITTTGEVYLYNIDATVSDDGRLNQYYGGKTFTNDGIFYVEAISAMGSGSNSIINNDILFVKEFITDGNSNSMSNSSSSIDSGYGTIEDGGGSPYAGSYLFYCSTQGSINYISNSGTTFYTAGETNFPGEGTQVSYFSSGEECENSFYNDISSALPITLTSFDGVLYDTKIELQWTTASEKDNNFFTLYRSSDGYEFAEIATIGGQGTTNESVTYNHTDQQPKHGVNYYKLTQTDLDGKTKSFPVISVYFSEEKTFQVSPTIAKEGGSIRIDSDNTTTYQVELLNNEGIVINKQTLCGQSDLFILGASIQEGHYFIRIINDNTTIIKQILIID